MSDSEPQAGPPARFFEDFTEGEQILTQGRTITETDASLWAMFTGDMNPMHVDDEYATRHGLFGGRFPPGLMVVAIASGLKERLGLFAGTGLAMLEQTIRYHSPAIVGDTVHVTLTVERVSRQRGRCRGIVEFKYEIHKGDAKLVADGEWTMLVAARTEQGEDL
ncbi:MAG: MaoC family dehydratase [Acidimicrobiia bacterium]